MDFLSSHSGCQVLLRAPRPGAGLALSPPRWQSPGASVAMGAPERGMVPSSPPGGGDPQLCPTQQVHCRLVGLRHLCPGWEHLGPLEATASGWLT